MSEKKVVMISLPDFDDMMNLANAIGEEKTQLLIAKSQLDEICAKITDVVSTDPKYAVGNKPPSMTYVKNNYHVLGIDDETRDKIKSLRNKIAVLEGDLRQKELLFEVYRDMIDVWRTESANKRGTFYEG